MKYFVKTLNDTEKIAKHLANKIKDKEKFIVYLYGDLGSGKTTFVRLTLKNLGIRDFRGSPSFSIINEYKTKNKKIYHIDLYRLNNKDTLNFMGILDYFEEKTLFFVEWPNLLEIEPNIVIKFQITDNKRSIEFD